MSLTRTHNRRRRRNRRWYRLRCGMHRALAENRCRMPGVAPDHRAQHLAQVMGDALRAAGSKSALDLPVDRVPRRQIVCDHVLRSAMSDPLAQAVEGFAQRMLVAVQLLVIFWSSTPSKGQQTFTPYGKHWWDKACVWTYHKNIHSKNIHSPIEASNRL